MTFPRDDNSNILTASGLEGQQSALQPTRARVTPGQTPDILPYGNN
jgi:hypothetical protein